MKKFRFLKTVLSLAMAVCLLGIGTFSPEANARAVPLNMSEEGDATLSPLAMSLNGKDLSKMMVKLPKGSAAQIEKKDSVSREIPPQKATPSIYVRQITVSPAMINEYGELSYIPGIFSEYTVPAWDSFAGFNLPKEHYDYFKNLWPSFNYWIIEYKLQVVGKNLLRFEATDQLTGESSTVTNVKEAVYTYTAFAPELNRYSLSQISGAIYGIVNGKEVGIAFSSGVDKAWMS